MKNLFLFKTSNYDNVNKKLYTCKLFDNIILYNENDLDEKISNIVNDIIDKYGLRGYGYWIWKPYLILQLLNKMNENDILVHLDCHCLLSRFSKERKMKKIEKLLQEQPIIIGMIGNNDYMYTTTKLRKVVEKYLDYEFSKEQLEDVQYEGGELFIRNCEESRRFFQQCFDIMVNNIKEITHDYDQDDDNHETFIQNRNDQSVISLLYKYYNYKTPDWLTWQYLHSSY